MLDYVIIGSGIAGLSTARHLAEQGFRNGVILEKDPEPAGHATTNNSGMIHHYHPAPAMREQIAGAVRDLREEEAAAPVDYFRETGSLFLFSPDILSDLRSDPEAWGDREQLSPEQIPAGLKPNVSHPGVWVQIPRDGLLDPDEMVRYYVMDLEENSIFVETGEEVIGGTREDGVWQIETSERSLRARTVVNAAGEWANHIARKMNVEEQSLTPRARHLFRVSERLLPREWGFYWDNVHDVYFRDREDGTLLSVCDNHPVEPGTDPDVSGPENMLEEQLIQYYPQFYGLDVVEYWSCCRTGHRSGTPYIEEDDGQEGFYWVAGLEGHGMTAGHWVGQEAANLISERLDG